MLEWLIVGGGIHGTYLGNLLSRQPGISPDSIGILDPHDRLLAAWDRMTANCGMRYLRSPATHNIDIPIFSIYQYGKTPQGQVLASFIPPYNRPSLALFRAHSHDVVTRWGLDQKHIKGRALVLHRDGSGFSMETTVGSLRARRILLAIGMSDQPCWPDWAQALRREGAPVAHVFDPDFWRSGLPADGDIMVVGGGITAAQTALALAAEQPSRVTLVSRRPLQESQFDFNPCWIGPKCLRRFYREDYETRRVTIDEARVPGSLPVEVLAEFETARKQSHLTFQEAAIRTASYRGGTIRLQTDRGGLEAGRIVLATGFRQQRPGGAFIDRLVDDFGLSCNPCGYPLVGPDLQWGRHIYVTGPLAELQIGPCARNIVGARNAGRMLLAGRNFS